MNPRRSINRRSFLSSVAGAALAGGALLTVTGRAEAQGWSRDAGAASDHPARGGRREPGDSDFTRPQIMGDVVFADESPQAATGLTDRDSGAKADPAGGGVGRNRARIHARRCAELRARIARYERTRSADAEQRLATLRPYLARWGCR